MAEVKEYTIIPPAIPSARIYLFTTDTGLNYEVRFGRMQDDILKATIIFGVTNDEFEGEEYVVTNHGELYRVMQTIVKIVKMFMAEHPAVMHYEFTGLARDGEDDTKSTARFNLYKRYVLRIFDSSWKMQYSSNKIIASK